ncbi:hypothetical protein BOX15_Mlig013862g1, partial [Macrostomum lignano]
QLAMSSYFLRHRRPNVQRYLKAYVNEYFPYHKPEVTSIGLKAAERKGLMPTAPFPLAIGQVEPYGRYDGEFHKPDSDHEPSLVRVQVKKLCLNRFILRYYYQSATYLAYAGRIATKPGDLVLVEKTPEPMEFNCVYRLVKIIFSDGCITDPVTGLRCYGGKYQLPELEAWSQQLPRSGGSD